MKLNTRYQTASAPTHGATAARKLVLAAALAMSAIIPVSCAVTDDEVAVLATSRESRKSTTAIQAQAPIKYSYTTTSLTARNPSEKKIIKEKRTYLGSAPYICSPSGFGQKSTCVTRASL